MSYTSVSGSASTTVDLADIKVQELHRLTELGRLSTHLLHEISNPLTAAILHLEQIERYPAGVQDAKRSMYVLQRYIAAARKQLRQQDRAQHFNLNSQLEDVKQIVRPLARQAHVQLHFQRIDNVRLYGDPIKLQQIIVNLIANAIDSYKEMSFAGCRRQVRVTFQQQGQWLSFNVIDRGAGISKETLPYIFEPFFTTKNKAGRGLGVGLAMIKSFVEIDFGGSITVSSSINYGTTFRVKLRLNRNEPGCEPCIM